jgi:hypothetical protein
MSRSPPTTAWRWPTTSPLAADGRQRTARDVIQREWPERRANTWHHLTREAPLAHYGALKNILTRHADLLTAEIDPDGSRTRR